jgi:hypothetical protein
MKKVLYIFALVALSAAFTVSCSKDKDKDEPIPDSLAGTSWSLDETVKTPLLGKNGIVTTYSFTSATAVTKQIVTYVVGQAVDLPSEEGTYTYQKPNVTITIEDSEITGVFESGSVLKIGSSSYKK